MQSYQATLSLEGTRRSEIRQLVKGIMTPAPDVNEFALGVFDVRWFTNRSDHPKSVVNKKIPNGLRATRRVA